MLNHRIDPKDLACVDVVSMVTVAGCCEHDNEHGNETSRLIKGGKFINQVSDFASKKNSFISFRFAVLPFSTYSQ
jgi:hypothetical protein